jgi:hypothetical protein
VKPEGWPFQPLWLTVACIATLQRNLFIQPVMGDWLLHAGKAGEIYGRIMDSLASSKAEILNLEFLFREEAWALARLRQHGGAHNFLPKLLQKSSLNIIRMENEKGINKLVVFHGDTSHVVAFAAVFRRDRSSK